MDPIEIFQKSRPLASLRYLMRQTRAPGKIPTKIPTKLGPIAVSKPTPTRMPKMVAGPNMNAPMTKPSMMPKVGQPMSKHPHYM